MEPASPLGNDELVRIAFDLAPSGMLAVAEAGEIVAVNRESERLFGWSREELIGKPIETLVPPRFRGGHPGHRAAFTADPHSRPMGAGRELYGLRRDGTEFPIEVGLNPVKTPQGFHVLVSVVDITARRKLEEDQRRSQRLETIGVLAGGIAHDFNNILLGIVGYTELVLREMGESPQAREDLGRVLKAAERGRQLVQRIMTFSRDAEVARTFVWPHRIAKEVIELLRASLPSTVEIRADIDPETPGVLADETQLHQILMNLATNSAQAMPAGGVLAIGLHPVEVAAELAQNRPGTKAGPHVRLTVSDTGAGMTPEVLERALDPFFTTKAPGQGTGLGLSVVHGIVTSHGGVMEIASTPGSGTTVTIDLPVAEDPALGPAPGAPEVEQRRLRILFVEDETVLATMQKRQMEHLGFDVAVHTSSIEALEAFRAAPDTFQLLITDDTMPRMTGSALTQEVLRIRPGLPVLMISGGDRSGPGKPRPAGVTRVLRKPHTVAQLEQAIREVLG
jgi:PAS domain S-box-containing protein